MQYVSFIGNELLSVYWTFQYTEQVSQDSRYVEVLLYTIQKSQTQQKLFLEVVYAILSG